MVTLSAVHPALSVTTSCVTARHWLHCPLQLQRGVLKVERLQA
jgi:hypothetical protein